MNYLDNLTTLKTTTPKPIIQNRSTSSNVKFGKPQDTVCFYEMSEEMEKVTGYIGGGAIYTGKLNGKESEIKLATFKNGVLEIGGTFGEKKLSMTTYDYGSICKGTYNGKEFEINATQDKRKEYIKSLSGHINGESFEIDFSEMPTVPKDGDTRDIISAILFANGNMPFVIDGKISKIVMSHTSNGYFKRMEEDEEKRKNEYILPAISMVGGSIMTILTTLITNKLFGKR